MDNLKKLGGIFSAMVENDGEFNGNWKNIPLGHQAFTLMKEDLPLRVKGELTPYTRIMLLNKMMDCMPERDCARFFREVKEYQMSLFPLIGDEDSAEDMEMDGFCGPVGDYVRKFTPDDLKKSLQKTLDYIDRSIPMEEWCDRYGVWLKFDPVERSEEWENCIYEVEAECDRKLKGEPKGMGFCFSYWSTKKAVLAKFGIDWSSPSAMNPRVRFD